MPPSKFKVMGQWALGPCADRGSCIATVQKYRGKVSLDLRWANQYGVPTKYNVFLSKEQWKELLSHADGINKAFTDAGWE